MRGWTLAGIITATAIAIGAATLAQAPLEPASRPPAQAAPAPPPARPVRGGPVEDEPPVLADVSDAPSPETPDDPNEAIEAFVRRNRKEADQRIKALTEERDRLRARLQKVEAALGRWHQVARALETRPGGAPPEVGAEPPLEPAPPVEPPPTGLPR